MVPPMYVCHSVHSRGTLYKTPPPPRPVQVPTIGHFQLGPQWSGIPSPDPFKFVYSEAWTVDKRGVGFRLKCFLVKNRQSFYMYTTFISMATVDD